MVSTFISLLDIQSWWEIPCIAHFCSLFSSAFELPDIDIEDLESALLTDGTDDTVGLLPELIVCLLKGCDSLKNRDEITTSNYQMFLRRFLRHQCRLYNTKNYFDTDIDFQSLPLRNKLLILYSLCHFRLESSNVQTILANLEADSLRVEPLGYDSKNSEYWYFYGTRLYREDSKPGGKSTVWQVVCFTEEDWQNLASKFKNSTSPKERALYKILTDNFIPKLPQLFRERERLRRRKLLQVRTSARINNLREEKQKILSQKQETEDRQREKVEEELKLQAATKSRTRTRRRSQSSSTASGISTYASSIRASSPSSEFLTQHETFCLSPGLGEVDVESISPKLSSPSYNNDFSSTKEIDSDTESNQEPICAARKKSKLPKEDNNPNESDIEGKITSINSLSAKRSKSKNKPKNRESEKQNSSSCCESDSESKLARRRKEMAPTSNIKLPGRQTNNSLSSIPENLFLSSVFSNTHGKKKNKSKSTKNSKTASSENSKIKEKEKEKAKSKDKEKDKEKYKEKEKEKQKEKEKEKEKEREKEKEKEKEKEREKEKEKQKEKGNSIVKDKEKDKDKLSTNKPESNTGGQKKKKNKNSETYTEKDEILQIGMHKVLLYVKNHRDAWPFMDPVDEDIAPRYYSIIRRPMDLLKMEEKLDNEEYKKYSEFRNDFKLIVNNCRLYNGQNNEYTEMVNNLQDAFDKATKKYLDQQSSDEDETFEYPDPRSNVFREKASKANSPKTMNKDIEMDTQMKKDEETEDETQRESDEDEEELNDDNGEENQLNKKKRREKDKRRKKKSKSKTQHNNACSDDEKPIMGNKPLVAEKSGNEADPTQVSNSKGRKRLYDDVKTKAQELPTKRAKTKSEETEKEELIKAGKKEIAPKKSLDKRGKKSLKSTSRKVVMEAKDDFASDDKNVGLVESGSESMSEVQELENMFFKSRSNSNRKHSLSQDTIGRSSKRKPGPPEEATKCPGIHDKTNQNCKSKNAKITSNSVSKVSASKETAKSVKDQAVKDNKKDVANARRKTCRGKVEETKNVIDDEKGKEQSENECVSLSRSSSPLFTVDLHKKYAKSASIKDDDSSSDEIKDKLESPAIVSTVKDNDDDLLSITSQSLSRSASPFNSFDSDVEESEKDKRRKENSDKDNNFDESEKSASMDIEPTASSTSSSYFYLDKYDLIKQRRNRNTEEKWNQIVKEAEKIKDTKKATMSKSSSGSLSKEKNQKLKETIEKLKVKNAKSKERSVLIDEIFGVKPTQQPRDEKTIFEKLRESCLDAKCASPQKKVTAFLTPAQPVKQIGSDAYDFVEDVAPKPVLSKTVSQPAEKSASPAKKSSSKKTAVMNTGVKKPAPTNKTNLEALELETEQTLKDINRWLEHTPRFSEFSSASNSPSRYNLLDDFDAVTSKIDPSDFRRPNALTTTKLEAVGIDEIAENKQQEVIEDLIPPLPVPGNTSTAGGSSTASNTIGNSLSTVVSKTRESPGTTQFLANPPPPPHVKSQQQKESKRKTLKEKLTNANRRKDILRTIDRLQPGKAKGNLIGSSHSSSKAEDLFPPAAASKIKEVKNSLVVKTDESGPKLSMGSVLQTEGFGLGQLHNFVDNDIEKKSDENSDSCEKIEKTPTTAIENTDAKEIEVEKPKEVENKLREKNEKVAATPNLSAWFKAFGAPKKAKKLEEEEKKSIETANISETSEGSDRASGEQTNTNNSLNTMKSPPANSETFSLPAPRQRKASTGSTVSERSSFSQDPDSPRVGIDDRFGAYTGPYPSPIGASPIMVSPKPDEIGKPTSPYPLNGAIKVGFYQDTTTKSSPEKSCSPREMPSPYPQYSQHVYSSASSPTVNTDVTNSYGGCYNTNAEANKNPVYSSTPTSLFDQYKQPRSQETDYNSMSPNPNSNSPYQQPQSSPYHQHQTSPYQQQHNSPYQQAQNSPFQGQNTASNIIGSSPNSPNMPSAPQQPQGETSGSQPTSPYHQQTNSPYQQQAHSPYHQNPTSPYQASAVQPPQSQQPNLPFVQPQQQQQGQSVQPASENTQKQVAISVSSSSSYHPENPTYSMRESSSGNQYQSSNRSTVQNYDTDLSKSTVAPTTNMLNKIQQGSDWNTQMDLTASQAQSERSVVPITDINSISHAPNQLNTPPLQSDQLTHMQADKVSSMQYPNFPQFSSNTQKTNAKDQNMFGRDLGMDMSLGMNKNDSQAHQHQVVSLKPQTNESSIIGLNAYSDSSSRQQKPDQSQMPEKQMQFDSVQKHQQMFDSFLGSMVGNKSLGFGKSLDVPSGKAFEMFNRAAAIGFPKDFANPLHVDQQKSANNIPVANSQPPQMTQQSYHIPSSLKSLDVSSASNASQNSNKPLNMASNNFQHQAPQHINESITNKLSTFPNVLSNPAADMNKLQHPAANVYSDASKQSQQLTATNYSNADKMTNEAISMPNARQDQMGQLGRNQQINMELGGYKTYNNPNSVLEPLRNLNHPLSMMDESLLGLTGSTASSGYYDKNIPPAAHMFSKNLNQPIYQNHAGYGSASREQQNIVNNFIPTATGNANTAPAMDNFDTKQVKRKKKKASVVPSTTDINTNTMLPAQQQQSMQTQNPQSTQGFQLYSDLKTSVTAATDTSAISLKTASSMVPGSAFNFGPSPAGLGLPTGMYGDNSGYLDPYYLPPSHRAPTETGNEKTNNVATATASATPYQFLAHNPVRPTYPFMNSQLDPNSPIYQQYMRQEQELRARMMINQGLLGSAAGAAGSYGQPGYRPPTLGMPKHYDMSRQTWF